MRGFLFLLLKNSISLEAIVTFKMFNKFKNILFFLLNFKIKTYLSPFVTGKASCHDLSVLALKTIPQPLG